MCFVWLFRYLNNPQGEQRTLKWYLLKDRIKKSFGLQGILRSCSSKSPSMYRDTFHWLRFLRGHPAWKLPGMVHNEIVQLLDKGSRKGIQPGVRSCRQLCSVCCSRTSPTATAHSMQWLIQSSPSRWCIHVTHSASSSYPCALCSRTISFLPAACGSQDHGGKVVMRIWCQPKACPIQKSLYPFSQTTERMGFHVQTMSRV